MSNNYKIKVEPLVTILIITYNSEKFVLQTLESAKNQTYESIQLIVSDDGSTDKTIGLIKKWLNDNGKYFRETVLVTSDVNTGINANCNRGLGKVKGDWLKLIAGDDILAQDCIKLNIDFIARNINSPKLVVSQIVPFSDSGEINFWMKKPEGTHEIFQSCTTAERQFELLIRGKFINGSSAFYNVSILKEMKGFTTMVRSLEDYPTFLSFTYYGYKIYFLEQATVYYRHHVNSQSHRENKQIFPLFFKDITRLMVKYSYLKKDNLLLINSYWNRCLVLIIFFFGNKGEILKILDYLRQKISPIRIRKLFKINASKN